MVLLCKASGTSSITENIFQGRFLHAMELQRLGAKITIKNKTANIEGNTNFIAAEVMSSDLRASAALVLAGIVSKGKTIVTRVYHCDRGYENFENKLKYFKTEVVFNALHGGDGENGKIQKFFYVPTCIGVYHCNF